MELENNNNDFLAQPENLKLNGYNSDWARYLTLKYQNSSDCSDEYSKVKIDLFNNKIIPIYPKIDDSTKKWFGSSEALLSNDNIETYSSSMLMIFSNNIDDDYGEWRVLWHDIIEGLDDGNYPEVVSDSKLDEIFSGSWFSKIHSFLNQNS